MMMKRIFGGEPDVPAIVLACFEAAQPWSNSMATSANAQWPGMIGLVDRRFM
jgi:hypothetical protein